MQKTVLKRNNPILKLWIKWEKIYQKLSQLQNIEYSPLLFYKHKIYAGKPIQLANGNVIKKGDEVFELHFNNEYLFHLSHTSGSSFHLAKLLIQSFSAAKAKLCFLLSEGKYENVKALYGISILHRGAKQNGFTVCDLPKGLSYHFKYFYLQMLLCILHPEGHRRLRGKSQLLVPKLIAISVNDLKKQTNN